MGILNFLVKIFDSEGFPPRWHCGQWSDAHGWLHILSDVAIFGAYFTIPVLMAGFIHRRRSDLPFNAVFWCFVGFILFCGTTHLIEAVIFWEPMYRFSGVLKLLTAVISWVTVFLLIQVIPRALRLQSPKALQVEVEQRTHELLQSELKLQKINQELSQKKEDLEFIMHAFSHDLKSPLVSVLGFVDLLKQDIQDQNQVEVDRDLERIENSSVLLKNMLDGFLLSLKQDKMQLKPKWIDPLPMIQNVLKEMEDQVQEKNIEFLVQDQFHKLYADELGFVSIVSNLLHNAVQYGSKQKSLSQDSKMDTEETSKIWISDLEVDDGVWIFVRDEGPGIPEEMKKKIFQMFVRLESSEAGSGLGLHIVSKIAQKHGGKVELNNVEGGGTQFGVFFPKEHS